jgi:hypothetical protein
VFATNGLFFAMVLCDKSTNATINILVIRQSDMTPVVYDLMFLDLRYNAQHMKIVNYYNSDYEGVTKHHFGVVLSNFDSADTIVTASNLQIFYDSRKLGPIENPIEMNFFPNLYTLGGMTAYSVVLVTHNCFSIISGSVSGTFSYQEKYFHTSKAI